MGLLGCRFQIFKILINVIRLNSKKYVVVHTPATLNHIRVNMMFSALATQSVVHRQEALALPGSWLEVQNLSPTQDLLNQNLYINKIFE